jgi:hypothetical protein
LRKIKGGEKRLRPAPVSDLSAIAIADPAHSAPGDERFVTIGMSKKTVCCLWFRRKQTVLSISSAPGSLLQPKENSRKNPETSGTAAKPTAVRGKYANLLHQGTNVAILNPDFVKHFPTPSR